MLSLGIETSSRAGSIALRREGQLVAERDRTLDRRHAQSLIPELQQMLADSGVRALDIDVIAVSVGPGSFTGLRVGVVCAKTLGYAARRDVAAIVTLEAVAANSPADVQRVQVVSDAQRRELFVGEYFRDRQTGRWSLARPISIVPGDDWLATLTKDAVVTGPGLQPWVTEAAARCRVLAPELWIPRAAVIAEMGEQAHRTGELVDAIGLQPFYLRKSAAEEKWDETKAQG
jgi:tRNA threonylcarbamoyladenosine biosynthesis protein TsaB